MKGWLPVLTFILRHALALPVAVVLGCALWTIVYLLLLLAAILTDEGLGGPLAYPAGLAAVAVTVFLAWCAFVPACALGNLSCAIFKLPRLAAIPFVSIAGYMLCLVVVWIHVGDFQSSLGRSLFVHAVFLSLPLGVYWWLTEGPAAIYDIWRRWRKGKTSKAVARAGVSGT